MAITKVNNYILITPAYNEEKYIEKTIESVIAQTVRPIEWIIVSDGSTDTTDEIIKKYLKEYPFIKFLRFINNDKYKTNLGKVSKRMHAAINAGFKIVENKDYCFFGNLDADVSFKSDYYENLLNKFENNPKLGLAGGYVFNVQGDKKWGYFTNPENVGGPIQFFRRTCWDEIGGYFPGGHLDYFAVKLSKMKGWQVQSFPDIAVFHYKHASAPGKSQLQAKFHLGQMDRICGEIFLYSLIRAIISMKNKPLVIGGLVRILGYGYSWIKKTELQVPTDLFAYLRKEQMRKLSPQRVFHLLKKG